MRGVHRGIDRLHRRGERRRVAELERLLTEATGRKPEPTADVRPLRNVRGSDPAAG